MAFVQWNGSMAVGVERIDAQHRELIALINDLGEALGTDQQQEVVAKAAFTLVRYAREHLRDEEALMAENGFPEAEQHIREHHSFEEALHGFDSGGAPLDMGAVNKMFFFLSSWLVNHICRSDQKFGRYLKAHGKPAAAPGA
jgi:hemerythrin